MTVSIAAERLPARFGFNAKLAFAIGVTALGDWLFYDHEAGLSAVLFLTALALGAAAMRPREVTRRDFALGAGFLLMALLPLVESFGVISLLFGIVGTALFAVIVSGGLSKGLSGVAFAVRRLILVGSFQFIPDLLQAHLQARVEGRVWLPLKSLIGWVVPILSGAVFVALFASANPLIEEWVTVFDPLQLSWDIDILRIVVWILLLSVAWPFISVRLRERAVKPATASAEDPKAAEADRIFGADTVLRSLVLFNLLFAVQSILDALYLWGGVALPSGMTYAAYAHRGAYPLIVTALLAAAFVLISMRPGGTAERSPTIRRLVYLWIGQNVLLVVSSILRLDLYIAIYSLTLLRIAAFIWMFLVAAGLILIVARIALRRSNGWLIASNALVLALTLYVCAFVNFAAIIANYNLSYRREVMAGATSVDAYYVYSLGPQVLPALNRYIARGAHYSGIMTVRRDQLLLAHSQSMEDWRAWTFRDWRLQHYLTGRTSAK